MSPVRTAKVPEGTAGCCGSPEHAPVGGGQVATARECDLWGKGQQGNTAKPCDGFGMCHAGLCHSSSPVDGDSPVCTREPRAVVTQQGEAAVPQVTAAAPRHRTVLRGTPSSTVCVRTTAAAAVSRKNIPAAAAVEQEPGGDKHGSDTAVVRRSWRRLTAGCSPGCPLFVVLAGNLLSSPACL